MLCDEKVYRTCHVAIGANYDEDALTLAVERLTKKRKFRKNPLHGQLAAISVGIYRGEPVLDPIAAPDWPRAQLWTVT